MIKIENVEVLGWEHAIRGMRNPKNSWKRSDSHCCDLCDENDTNPGFCDDEITVLSSGTCYTVGPNDHDLMMRLAKGGPVHAKYRRMITVYLDITAPLYWWKEFDTYKVGTVANSCSTMHKIADKEFTLEDFSHEHLIIESERKGILNWGDVIPMEALHITIRALNESRIKYLQTNDKKYWWQMIQLLPSSYNQKRTIMLNYEVLNNMYHSRKDHKLDEWREFCAWIESLPYSEIITGGKEENSTAKLVETILSKDKEKWPTACDLCNSQGCGDSNEEVCKKCNFYKHSKWAKKE